MFSDLALVFGRAVLVTDAMFAPVPAWWLRAAASADGVIAAVAQAGAGTCQVVDSTGRRWDSGVVAFGVQCVGIEATSDGWLVTWMLPSDGRMYRSAWLNRNLSPVTFLDARGPGEGTSQGFLDVFNGLPVFTDSHRTVTLGPLTIGLPTTRGHWTIGQDWHGDRIVGWNAQTQTAWEISRVSTQTPSHLVIEDDGTAVVVMGGTDIVVRQPAFVPWAPWEVPPLEVAQSSRPIAVGCFDEPYAPDLTGHGYLTTDQTVGVFIDLAQGAAIIEEQTQRAIRDGLPLYCYKDAAGLKPSDMPPWAGARRLAMARNTPEPGEGREAAASRLRATVKELRHAGLDVALDIHLARGMRGDGSYTWTEQELVDRACDAWQIAVDEGVLAVWCFAWARADGIAAFPAFEAFVASVRAATPNWKAFPLGLPTPIRPPKPEPPHPKPPIPVPMPGFALELLMTAFTLPKSQFVLNTAADVADPVFLAPNFYHVKHPDGGYVSIDPATSLPSPTGAAKVGGRENFHYDGKDRAVINAGLPLQVRTVLVDVTL